MNTPLAKPHSLSVLAACLLTGATAFAQEAPSPPAAETTQVQRGELVSQVRATGRYTAQPLGDIRFEAEGYSGSLRVAEVVRGHGRVSPGEVILRLEAPDMEDQLEAANRAATQAAQRLDWALQEQAMADIDYEINVTKRELALADATEDYALWNEFRRDDLYAETELDMEGYAANIADQAEELSQLEELYEGARLASRTQDIVLERARRRLAMSQQSFEMAQRAHAVTMEVTLPRRERDTENRMKWTTISLEHASVRAQVAQARQQLSIEAAERSLEDAQEALANLELDAASLEVKAQAAGVMTSVSLTEGDLISNKQTIAQLQSQNSGTLTMNVNASDLRTLAEGDTVHIRWQPFGEVQTTGTIAEIAWVGQGSGNSTTYRVTLDVAEVASVIRPGMTANITATRALDNALSLPREAVGHDENGSFCMVQQGNDFVRQEIFTGAGNQERIQIIDGLEEGQAVRVPAQ